MRQARRRPLGQESWHPPEFQFRQTSFGADGALPVLAFLAGRGAGAGAGLGGTRPGPDPPPFFFFLGAAEPPGAPGCVGGPGRKSWAVPSERRLPWLLTLVRKSIAFFSTSLSQ